MNEEEKKAIELLRKLKKKTPYIIWGDGTPYNKSNQIQTVLNLIEKQQKEIENLKEINKEHQKLNEKIIQEMANYIKNEWGFANNDEVIDYFRKRVEKQ